MLRSAAHMQASFFSGVWPFFPNCSPISTHGTRLILQNLVVTLSFPTTGCLHKLFSSVWNSFSTSFHFLCILQFKPYFTQSKNKVSPWSKSKSTHPLLYYPNKGTLESDIVMTEIGKFNYPLMGYLD